MRDKFKSQLKVDKKKGNTEKVEKLGAGQMINNIVSFNHLQIMEQIVEMNKNEEIEMTLDLTDNVDEVLLLNLAMKNKNYDMIACLAKLGLKPKAVWGKEYQFMEIRDHYINQSQYGLEFANEYLGASDLIYFKLEQFDEAEGPSDDGYLGWGGGGARWGARLKGGCQFAIDWKNKKFMVMCNYVAYSDFGEGHITNKGAGVYKGFDRIYALWTKLFDGLTDDFKFYFYQCGTGYYYETDYSLPIKEGESLKDWRLRTYRITQRGSHTGPRGTHWRELH